MFTKLKQIKDLRAQAKKIQSALGEERVTTDAAGGKVRVAMNGNQEILSVDIDPLLMAPSERERVQAGIKDAVNSAIKRVQQVMAKKVKDMGGIPGMNV